MGLLENERVDFSEEHYKGKNFMEQLFRPGPYVVAEVPAWTQDPSGEVTQFIKRLDKLEFGNLIQGVILGAYDRGNMVIVGRGGQALLADKPDVLHVRIQAPLALRVKRLQEHEGLEPEEAQKKIRERDLSDVGWIKRYFGLDSHEPSLFDVIINTAKYTPVDATDLIIKALDMLPKAK